MLLPLEPLKKMLLRDRQPSAISYSAAASACEKGADWLLPFELSKEVRQWKLKLCVMSYSAAINAHQRR